MLTSFWIEFIANNALIGATAEVPPPRDQSGLGAELAFLTEEQSIDEATNFWLGLAVVNNGVRSCRLVPKWERRLLIHQSHRRCSWSALPCLS